MSKPDEAETTGPELSPEPKTPELLGVLLPCLASGIAPSAGQELDRARVLLERCRSLQGRAGQALDAREEGFKIATGLCIHGQGWGDLIPVFLPEHFIVGEPVGQRFAGGAFTQMRADPIRVRS